MKSFGCMPAVRTPEASRTLTVSCPGILPSPLRDKVGAFHHDRFRGYVSVHFRSGLPLPVYASQWPLPDTTQDSVRGCSLRLCRGCHLRQLSSTRLQGATPTDPTVRRYRSGLFRKDRRRIDHLCQAWWITGSGSGKAVKSRV